MQTTGITFPAEWYPQSAVQLTWPHEDTDWAPILDEVTACFVEIAREIMKREKLLIVCQSEEDVRNQLGEVDEERVRFVEMPTNDTWARDHGGISVFDTFGPTVYDFVFNGWGMKFPAGKDNQITRNLFHEGIFADRIQPANMAPFVLEGGSIESDGQGTLMTTAECLLSLNRNEYEDTIAYVQCTDESDVHYDELQAMEEEIKAFRQLNGEPYKLIALPMADEVIWEGERLPATYANFLIINGAVLLPFYNSPKDEIARKALQEAFPDREIVGINCLSLIKQHGSLHCVTMQYPEGFIE